MCRKLYRTNLSYSIPKHLNYINIHTNTYFKYKKYKQNQKDIKIIKNKKNTYLYKNKKNQGAGQSRNFAIKKSKGEFLAFIDSDDIWKKRKLEIQIKFMKKKNIIASFTSYCIIDSFGKVVGFREAKKK